MLLLAMTSAAQADDVSIYERLWPAVPTMHRASLSQQLTDSLTELGNILGYHLDVLSADMLALKFDGRHRRARVRFGMFDSEYLTFKFDSVVQFSDGLAKIQARFDFGIAGHVMHVELPDMEMAPTEYHGERGVQLRVPLYRRCSRQRRPKTTKRRTCGASASRSTREGPATASHRRCRPTRCPGAPSDPRPRSCAPSGAPSARRPSCTGCCSSPSGHAPR